MMNNTDREYLERLLSFASRKGEESAVRLADEYRDIQQLLHIDSYTLMDIAGCDDKSASFLRLVAALTSRRISEKFKNGKNYLQSDIENFLCGIFFGSHIEMTYAMLFDKYGKFISLEHLGEGTVSSSSVSPRRILDIAFKKNATSIIIAHNHPCGKTDASITDIHVTSHLNMMLKNAGVELKNHYIISGFDIVDCLPSSR